VDPRPATNPGRFKKDRRRPVHQIVGVGGQARVVASQLDCGPGLGEAQLITQVYRMHHRFQLMKPVRAFAKNVQEQIHFAG
jgi:hypothetical protein